MSSVISKCTTVAKSVHATCSTNLKPHRFLFLAIKGTLIVKDYKVTVASIVLCSCDYKKATQRLLVSFFLLEPNQVKRVLSYLLTANSLLALESVSHGSLKLKSFPR